MKSVFDRCIECKRCCNASEENEGCVVILTDEERKRFNSDTLVFDNCKGCPLVTAAGCSVKEKNRPLDCRAYPLILTDIGLSIDMSCPLSGDYLSELNNGNEQVLEHFTAVLRDLSRENIRYKNELKKWSTELEYFITIVESYVPGFDKKKVEHVVGNVIKKDAWGEGIIDSAYTSTQWALVPYTCNVREEDIPNLPRPLVLDAIHPKMGFGVPYTTSKLGWVDIVNCNEKWNAKDKKFFRQVLNRNKDTLCDISIENGIDMTLNKFKEYSYWWLNKFNDVGDTEINAFIDYVQDKNLLIVRAYRENKLVALDISIIEEDKLYAILCSWNPELSYYNLGYYTVLKILEYAQSSKKYLWYWFGPTQHIYKLRFCTDFEEALGIALFEDGDERIKSTFNANKIR